ncbi:MAG TPA: DUF1269 domain-containing protein [Longilinea sp.]|nr:DUF1269 domain-containing protein [Longilinea sp.]
MIDLPTKAEVHCSDGVAGHSTYVIFNPNDHRLTNLVVKSDRPPFDEYLVPVDQVEETTNDRIKLKCTRKELYEMGPFEFEQYIRTRVTENPDFPYFYPGIGIKTQEVDTLIPVKTKNILPGEMSVRCSAQVEATDGPVGQVDELLINSNNMQVTHLVLLERQFLDHREITIPVSQIERVYDDTVYLKIDRQSVEQLPTTPVQRWPKDEHEEATLEKGAHFPLRFSSEGYTLDIHSKRRKMMDKMLVVVFDNEGKAYEASKALQELQNEGSINLYAKAVIARDADGKVEVKEEGDMGPVGTGVGLLTGSLIGLIGGPVGLAIGAYAGTVGGMVYDMANAGVGEDFLFEVEKSLLPGKTAVVAEVWEEWTMPVDTRMEALGGVVFRRTRDDVVDAQMDRDAVALEAELAELKAERDQATGEARAKLQAKVDKTKAKLQSKHNEIQARIEANQKETEAKIKSLQERAAKESGERKAKREARIIELQADQKRRTDLLNKARELAREALL